MTLTLDPPSIPADGGSTSVATAKVYKAGLVGREGVLLHRRRRDLLHSRSRLRASAARGTKIDAQHLDRHHHRSTTPGVETITATGVVSGLTATAELFEGGGWFDRTAARRARHPGRENAAMAYDEADGVTVLFGGYSSDLPPGSVLRPGDRTPQPDAGQGAGRHLDLGRRSLDQVAARRDGQAAQPIGTARARPWPTTPARARLRAVRRPRRQRLPGRHLDLRRPDQDLDQTRRARSLEALRGQHGLRRHRRGAVRRHRRVGLRRQRAHRPATDPATCTTPGPGATGRGPT